MRYHPALYKIQFGEYTADDAPLTPEAIDALSLATTVALQSNDLFDRFLSAVEAERR